MEQRYTQLIGKLRKRLHTETVFRNVVDQFEQDLMLDPGFLELGEPHEDKHLVEIVATMLGRFQPGPRFHLVSPWFARIASLQFVHGAMLIDPTGPRPRAGLVFHFEADGVGLFALGDLPHGEEVMVCRFSTRGLPGVPMVAGGVA